MPSLAVPTPGLYGQRIVHVARVLSVGVDEAGVFDGDWDSAYTEGWAAWDLGRPQPLWMRLADAGEITSPVLDSGCGTGEHALMLAERGMDVLGIDIAPTAVDLARAKAGERKLSAEFEVGDALELEQLGRTFATVIDSGVFHIFFAETDRARYVKSLASVLQPGGVLYLACFSELTPGGHGPRRVTQAELDASFATGWEITRIEPERFDVTAEFQQEPAHVWLARIVRT